VLNPKTPYDPVRDFAPVAHVANATNVLIASPALPVNSTAELVKYLRANPGRVNYGSSGIGTIVHLTAEQFKAATNTFIVHIPYRGTALVIPDLIAGQIGILFDSISSAIPHVRSGKVKALGVTAAKRSPLLPDVPTLDEGGVKGFESDTYFGLFAPAGTPSAITTRINAEVNRILQSNELRERFAAVGAEPVGGTPDGFARVIAREREKFAAVIKRAGVKAE
jgi:tripartite-type tricarboxylate transporter receptor subunit TctC